MLNSRSRARPQPSSAAGGSNFGNFKNPVSDRLLEMARQEFDAEKRKELYWQWQDVFQDEQPVTVEKPVPANAVLTRRGSPPRPDAPQRVRTYLQRNAAAVVFAGVGNHREVRGAYLGPVFLVFGGRAQRRAEKDQGKQKSDACRP